MNREEAIKIVKSHYPANKQMLNEALEFLIPELKESEDEKIRKDLITFLDEIWHLGKNANFDKWDKCDCSKWLAWIEKQSEHEYTLKSSNMLDISKLTDQITKLAKDYDFNLPNRSYDIYAFAKDILAWIEKEYKKSQGKSALESIKEENVDNANKVESTFKVGDWIVYNDAVWKVCNISLQNYYELLKINNEVSTRLIKDVDENAHLWTIQDAKEGDIIYAESKFAIFNFIVIFSKLENKNVWVYCSVCSDGNYYGDDLDHWEFDSDKGFIDLDSYKFYPASKEQRDILFKSMEENGYEWDAKKKKLK